MVNVNAREKENTRSHELPGSRPFKGAEATKISGWSDGDVTTGKLLYVANSSTIPYTRYPVP